LSALNPAPDDLVLSADVDEIPRASHVRILAHCDGFRTPVSLAMKPFMYDFGCREHGTWYRAFALSWRDILPKCFSRFVRVGGRACLEHFHDGALLYPLRTWRSIADAGWHLSY